MPRIEKTMLEFKDLNKNALDFEKIMVYNLACS